MAGMPDWFVGQRNIQQYFAMNICYDLRTNGKRTPIFTVNLATSTPTRHRASESDETSWAKSTFAPLKRQERQHTRLLWQSRRRLLIMMETAVLNQPDRAETQY